MDAHNLDLESYSLEDLLSLFDLGSDWSASQLKDAKRRAQMMHPDKSHLPPEYFRFFMKAYEELEAVTRFRDRSLTKEARAGEDTTCDAGLKAVVETAQDQGVFAEKFNSLFEQHGSPLLDRQKGRGHGEWLSGDGETQNIDERRAQLRASSELCRRPTSLESQGGSLLDPGEQTGHYQSDIFGKLRYDDVRHAHEESVLPVTPADLDPTRPRSLTGLQQTRSQLPQPMSRAEAREALDRADRIRGDAGAARAYRLRREVEQGAQATDAMRGKFLLLRR